MQTAAVTTEVWRYLKKAENTATTGSIVEYHSWISQCTTCNLNIHNCQEVEPA